MLETEIKKLTKALEDNTAALLGSAPQTPEEKAQANALQGQTAPAQPGSPPPLANPGIPNIPSVPAAVGPNQPPATPGAQPMTHQTAQAELTAIVQQLGTPAAVQAVMAKYGSNQLNQIPADSLFSMVQECKGLLTS